MRNLAMCLAVALLAGCGGGAEDDGKQDVSVTVTWNGTPIESGKLTLVDAGGVMDAGDIEDGNAELRTTTGEKTVMVTAEKSAGMINPAEPGRMEPIPLMYQYIPKKYNADSELKQSIADDTSDISIELSGEEIPPPKVE